MPAWAGSLAMDGTLRDRPFATLARELSAIVYVREKALCAASKNGL